MPTSAEILAGLTAIANEQVAFAIAWHALLAVALLAVLVGWRPTGRLAGVLVAQLLVSVSVFAFAYHNPFNGLVFAAGAVALAALAARSEGWIVARSEGWAWWAGVAMLAFGWVYPHFLHGGAARSLYAAPVGLVPCPTLSIAIGLTLLAGGLGGRAWRFVLAGLGGLYAIFGVVRLGVDLDLVLLFGAVALAATALEVLPTAAAPRGPRGGARYP